MKMPNFWETTLFGDINKSLHITPQSNLGNLGFINALSVWDHSKRKDAQKKIWLLRHLFTFHFIRSNVRWNSIIACFQLSSGIQSRISFLLLGGLNKYVRSKQNSIFKIKWGYMEKTSINFKIKWACRNENSIIFKIIWDFINWKVNKWIWFSNKNATWKESAWFLITSKFTSIFSTWWEASSNIRLPA